MSLFDSKIEEQLRSILGQMQKKVQLVFFSQEIECQSCHDAHQFVKEIAALNDKLSMEVLNLVVDKDKAAQYQVDKVPAIVVLDEAGVDTGIKFYGIPGGYEINSFLGAILSVSGQKEALPDDLAKRISAISKPVHIQVFVTPSCPYCPAAVVTAHRLALENKNIRADMVESNAFVYLTVRYQVSGVPKIVINEKHELTGAQPITAFLDIIEKL
ncbi:MAG: glutaredoxin [Ruminococcaceae bacterium]|jgi:glutaredoxin-like protein|nr:glutaredoxin [Oscillospiraceae bacterium]